MGKWSMYGLSPARWKRALTRIDMEVTTEVDWQEYERRKAEIIEELEPFDPKEYEQKIKELAEELEA